MTGLPEGFSVRAISDADADFSAFLRDAAAENYQFVPRLDEEWHSGANRFDKEGEILLGVFDADKLVAIGGLNIDPYLKDSRIGRLRHIYVLTNYRGLGLAGHLTRRLIEYATGTFASVRLRTDNPVAAKVYKTVGFQTISHESASHSLDL